MREAFGGAFMIKVMLIFLGIYIAFMAVALNYAKAFRVKNQIINIIEQYEGYEKKSSNNTEVKDIIGSYLDNMGYNVQIQCNGVSQTNSCDTRGYRVERIDTSKGTYYAVETYIRLELPFFNIDITIPINGETKVIKTLS